jgi:hypothetical protein
VVNRIRRRSGRDGLCDPAGEPDLLPPLAAAAPSSEAEVVVVAAAHLQPRRHPHAQVLVHGRHAAREGFEEKPQLPRRHPDRGAAEDGLKVDQALAVEPRGRPPARGRLEEGEGAGLLAEGFLRGRGSSPEDDPAVVVVVVDWWVVGERIGVVVVSLEEKEKNKRKEKRKKRLRKRAPRRRTTTTTRGDARCRAKKDGKKTAALLASTIIIVVVTARELLVSRPFSTKTLTLTS